MITLFIITIFIAELIIAFSIINSIMHFDKEVNQFNKQTTSFRYEARIFFLDSRYVLRTFVEELNKFKRILKRKREEYILNTIQTALIYMSLLRIKGKSKKILLAYRFGREIAEGIMEA